MQSIRVNIGEQNPAVNYMLQEKSTSANIDEAEPLKNSWPIVPTDMSGKHIKSNLES